MSVQPTPPEGDYLSGAQVTALLQPLDPARVQHLDGLSHLEGWDIRAQLNRVFGFARWSAVLVDLVQMYEEPTTTRAGVDAYRVGYRATVRLSIHSPGGHHLAHYQEAAAGESVMPTYKRGDCHDMAIKTAETQALKRCAVNLGTRYGLSLYDQGATHDVVARTLVIPSTQQPTTQKETTDDQPTDPDLHRPAAGSSPDPAVRPDGPAQD